MLLSSSLMDETFRCVEAIGYDKTVDALKKAQHQEIKFEDKRVEKVVEAVAKKMGVAVHEILYGNGRKNERKYAIGFCSHYLHSPEFFNIDMPLVAQFLNRENPTVCYLYAKHITKLNPNHVSDKHFYEMKKEFDVLFAKSNKK